MSGLWIVKTIYSDNSQALSLFSDEDEAYKQACYCIQQQIKYNMYTNGAKQADAALEINNIIIAREWRKATEKWNDTIADLNIDYFPMYYVDEHQLISNAQNPHIFAASFFSAASPSVVTTNPPSVPAVLAAPISNGYVPASSATPAVAVNDHTCTSCGNTSCSKSEKSCWKCGAAIRI
jgi:hypothetical protein